MPQPYQRQSDTQNEYIIKYNRTTYIYIYLTALAARILLFPQGLLSLLVSISQVGGLSKRQLSEIRRLLRWVLNVCDALRFAQHPPFFVSFRFVSRSPPEPVKRTLAACWLLLHCQRFKDKPSAVRFDEVGLVGSSLVISDSP